MRVDKIKGELNPVQLENLSFEESPKVSLSKNSGLA
jgi:hypothetical protein